MYNIKIEKFEGPFDLLFHLIEKNKIDIKDIPISMVFDQYMEYLNAMQELDLDIATEFIVMAATLLEIKSSTLLPRVKTEEIQTVMDEIDPRDELVKKLLEYKKYKKVSELFKNNCLFSSRYFKEEPDIKYLNKKLSLNYTANDLKVIYTKVINKSKEVVMPIKYSKEKFTIEEKIKELINKLVIKPLVLFSELIHGYQKTEKVVSFMAMLELTKSEKIKVIQKDFFGEILIRRR